MKLVQILYIEMNQIQDFSNSRFSEQAAQQKHQQQDVILRRNKMISVPISKLGYHNIFIRRQNVFVKKELPIIKKAYSIQQFEKIKDTYENSISTIIKSCMTQDENKQNKTINSPTKKPNNFNFNNWMNGQSYSCKINQQESLPLIAYYTLDLNFDKALKLIQTMPKSMQLSTLKIILKGFSTIIKIIQKLDLLSESNEYSKNFFNRSSFQMFQDNCSIQKQQKLNLLKIQFQCDSSVRKSSIQAIKTNGRETYIKFGNQLIPKKHSQQSLIKKEQKKCQEWFKLLQMSTQQKKKCILGNLVFLINFAQKVRTVKLNDYLKLVFLFLGNQIDQTDTAQFYLQSSPIDEYNSDKDQKKGQKNISAQYIDILLNLKDLHIYDRLNFAEKLLCKTKRQFFMKKLGDKLVKLPYLNNILFFTNFYREQLNTKSMKQFKNYKELKEYKQLKQIRDSKPYSSKAMRMQSSKQKQGDKINLFFKRSFPKSDQSKQKNAEKIIKICQNYIDQYGDLETVAYLAFDYPCLIKFKNYYRESLLLSYQTVELQKLDSKNKNPLEQANFQKIESLKKVQPFLSYINIKNQKISQIKQQPIQILKSCQICYQKVGVGKGQGFIQCAKCKHGGHITHIVRWLENYQHCPNIDCACLCN